jgi:hypothetical protein
LYLIFLLGRDRAGRKGVCGRLMSPAHETQSMREKRLLRGRLQRKGGGLTGMYLFLHYFYIFLARFTSLRLCCTLFIICCQQSSSLEYCFFLLQFMTTIEVENQIIFRGILFSKVYLLMDRYVVGISKKKINVIGKYSQICIMRSPLGQKKVAF